MAPERSFARSNDKQNSTNETKIRSADKYNIPPQSLTKTVYYRT